MTKSSGWIVRVTFRNHPPGTLVLSLWEDLDPQLDQGFRGTLNLTDQAPKSVLDKLTSIVLA